MDTERPLRIMNHTDETLLEDFFAEARQEPLAEGFTERVVAALPEWQGATEAATATHEKRALQRLLRVVNAVAAVVAVALLLRTGYDFMLYVTSIRPDDVFVNAMLALHRLPEQLTMPTAAQVLSTSVAAVVLMTMFIYFISQRTSSWTSVR